MTMTTTAIRDEIAQLMGWTVLGEWYRESGGIVKHPVPKGDAAPGWCIAKLREMNWSWTRYWRADRKHPRLVWSAQDDELAHDDIIIDDTGDAAHDFLNLTLEVMRRTRK